MDVSEMTTSVVKVGDGRGFVVKADDAPYIITAAHCLPRMPPALSFADLNDRTYPSIWGPLGADPSLWAECLFVDPVSDLAVLGAPDNQALNKEFRYRRLHGLY